MSIYSSDTFDFTKYYILVCTDLDGSLTGAQSIQRQGYVILLCKLDCKSIKALYRCWAIQIRSGKFRQLHVFIVMQPLKPEKKTLDISISMVHRDYPL